ncbi:hypothetical protein DSL64_21625 [Dyadobacter luteus]|uniref:Sigma-70 family RNA polymerase sigma factor n=1 Tax=Dyadobacter luteus TaxID=2259619 RepID=A0A3D8Y7I0_9BACT|nr:sigma-70 family RNA polymerase sigma factor [Dyadobacter luteus]REA58211.1 hypothetical protein DSL64_21625 [Dyadobacter luteus]
MSLLQLSLQSEKNSRNLSLFQTGDERGLTYFYQKSYSSLFWIGKELIDDEFLVDCILQECYLKVWAHREKIESFPHAYHYIRMNLRWQVLKQIQKPNYQIYRQSLHIDYFEKTFGELVDTQPSQDSGIEQKRIEELKKVMQYLSDKRQLIATLHFIDGLPARQIAERLKSSTHHISTEIEKSVEQLRQIVQVRKSSSPKEKQPIKDYPYSHILSQPQATVYALRQEQKMSFAGIASQLGWCQNQVQQHYIQAYQVVKTYWKQGRK